MKKRVGRIRVKCEQWEHETTCRSIVEVHLENNFTYFGNWHKKKKEILAVTCKLLDLFLVLKGID